MKNREKMLRLLLWGIWFPNTFRMGDLARAYSKIDDREIKCSEALLYMNANIAEEFDSNKESPLLKVWMAARNALARYHKDPEALFNVPGIEFASDFSEYAFEEGEESDLLDSITFEIGFVCASLNFSDDDVVPELA